MGDLNVIDRFMETFIRYIDSGFGLLSGDVAFLTTILRVRRDNEWFAMSAKNRSVAFVEPFRRDAALASHDLIDPLHWHTDVLRERNLRQTQRFQKLLQENLARMSRDATLGSTAAP